MFFSGQIEEALLINKESEQLNPNCGWGVPLLNGKIYYHMGKYEEALSWYQKALDVQPDHVPTLLEIGDTYVELGDCEQAVRQFLRVLEIQPNNTVAQDGLQACQGE